MTGWEVYWLTRLNMLHSTFQLIASMGITLGVITLVAWVLFREHEEFGETDFATIICRKLTLWLLLPGVVALMGFLFVPTLKDAAAIYLIPPIVNNEDVQEIPADAAKLLHNKLNEWIDDTAPQGHTKEEK